MSVIVSTIPGGGHEEELGVRSPRSWPLFSVSGNKRTLQREALCRAGPPQLTASAGAGPWAQPYLGGGRGLVPSGSQPRDSPAGAGTDRLALSPGIQSQRVGVRAGSEVQKHTRRAGPGQGQERALGSLALATESGAVGNTPIHLSFGQACLQGCLDSIPNLITILITALPILISKMHVVLPIISYYFLP